MPKENLEEIFQRTGGYRRKLYCTQLRCSREIIKKIQVRRDGHAWLSAACYGRAMNGRLWEGDQGLGGSDVWNVGKRDKECQG